MIKGCGKTHFYRLLKKVLGFRRKPLRKLDKVERPGLLGGLLYRSASGS
jgi:hypothetical protein